MKRKTGNRIIIAMLVAGMLPVSFSCQESREERLEREAREYTEKKCPEKMDQEGMFVLDSMVYRNDGSRVMRYYYSVDVDEQGLKAFYEMKDEMSKKLLDGIVNSADMRHIREEGVSVEYIYREKSTGKTITNFRFDKENYE